MNKRFVALLMGLILIVSTLAACGNPGVPKETGSGTSNETEGTKTPEETKAAEETKAPEVEQVREFEYFMELKSPYTETSPVYDALMEATGIKVNFTWTSSDAYNTLLSTRISENDLPDVIGGLKGSFAQQLVDAGVIIPLTDLLEEKMPNFTRFLTDEHYEYLRNANDGEIYSFGYLVDMPGQASWMIRQDWLDELNMDVPTTWDQWVEMWRAFKNNDLNHNGEADEIPLMIQYSSYFYYYLNMYGIKSNGTYSVVDGKAVYDCEHPLYMEWMDAMRGLYAEGIIPVDFVNIDSKARAALWGSNRVGSTCYDAAIAQEVGNVFAEIDEDAFVVCVPPVQSPYGEQVIRKRIALQPNTWVTTAAVEEGRLDAVLEFFDFVFSDEGIHITNYGFEGETYEMVDGKPVLKEPYVTGYAIARQYGLIPSMIPFYFTGDVYQSIMFKGQSVDSMDKYSQQAVQGVGVVNEEYFYSQPPAISTEESIEYTDLMAEQKALRDKYIMGLISKDEYVSEYEALKKAGLDEVFESVNAAYQNLRTK